MLVLVTAFCFSIAILRDQPVRIMVLAATAGIVSFLLVPFLCWLLTVVIRDGLLPIYERQPQRLIIWLHWQRGLCLGGLMFLAILWAAIENELIEHSSIKVWMFPPAALSAAFAVYFVLILRNSD